MRAYTDIFGRRFGFESNRVHVSGRPYIDRWIVYLGGLNLRVHRFWEGDDERAPHDHPWDWFVTFPFTGYWETVEQEWTVVCEGSYGVYRTMLIDQHGNKGLSPYQFAPQGRKIRGRRVSYVKPWRFHSRPGTYRHIVLRGDKPRGKPWWTFVIAGPRTRLWGFYPPEGGFVPWTEWL